MPAEIASELVLTAPASTIEFDLEPAFNNIYTLVLLNYSEKLSGLDDWVTRTWNTMSPERRHNNRLVMEGLHFAVVPIRSFKSFEEYLNDLTITDPITLRDRLLDRLVCPKVDAKGQTIPPRYTPEDLLDKETYIRFLLERHPDDTDVELEREANDYFTDPPRMHALILYHLQTMWREVLQPEWNRVRPLLQEAVSAFRAQDFAKLSPVEVARRVAGQELSPYLEAHLQKIKHLTLAPSAHIGPYLGKFAYEEKLWMLFGAHLPAGAGTVSPALTRSELVVRLSALNDDTRLRILELLSKRDELCAQDVITLLDLSQPAASRHLRQLTATGYVTERRREGNKCYALNRERFEDTCELMNRFLGNRA